jgi:hypothetical protein
MILAPPPHPTFPPLPTVISSGNTQERPRNRDSLLAGEGGGGRSPAKRRRESRVIYKSFNTLCCNFYSWLTYNCLMTTSPSQTSSCYQLPESRSVELSSERFFFQSCCVFRQGAEEGWSHWIIYSRDHRGSCDDKLGAAQAALNFKSCIMFQD